jgi:hypothetical protein
MTQLNFDLIQLPVNELGLFLTPNLTCLTTDVMATTQITERCRNNKYFCVFIRKHSTPVISKKWYIQQYRELRFLLL